MTSRVANADTLRVIASRVAWTIALIGIVPAIVSGVLFSWEWSGSPASTSIDPSYLAAFHPAVLWAAVFAAAGVAVWSRTWLAIPALVPMAMLAWMQPTSVSLDTGLISHEERLKAVSTAFLELPHDISSITREDAIAAAGRVVEVPLLTRWAGVSGALETFAQSRDGITDDNIVVVFATPPIDLAAPTHSQSALDAAIQASNAASDALVDFDICIETPGGEIAGIEPRGFPRQSRCGSRSLLMQAMNESGEEFKRLSGLVAAEKAAEAAKEGERAAALEGVVSKILARNAAIDVALAQADVWSRTIVYAVASLLAFLLFAVSQPLRSLPTAAVSLAAALCLLRVGTGGETRDLDFVLALASVYPLLECLAVLAGLRLFVLAIEQNIPIVRTMKPASALRDAMKTLVVWLPPFLVLTAAGWWVNNWVDATARDSIYSIKLEDGSFLVEKGSPPNVEVDINSSVDRHFAATEANFRANLGQWSGAAGEGGDWLASGIMTGFHQSVPDTLGCMPGQDPARCVSPDYYGGYECDWLDLRCRAERFAKRLANDVYGNARAQSVRALTATVRDIEGRYDNQRKLGEGLAKAEATSAFLAVRDEVKRGIWSGFRALDIVSLISNLLIVLALVKSWLFVFSRFAFHKDGDTLIEGPGSDGTDGAALVHLGVGQRCPLAPGDYYVRVGRDVTNSVGKFVFPPQPLTAFFSRFFKGAWGMRLSKIPPNPGTEYALSAESGREFVTWTLEPGQELFFDLKHFVAMNTTIRLKTAVSLRLTTMFFGRMFFTSAVGPGVLILLADGRPDVGLEQATSFAPSRLMAWLSTARFKVNSNLNFLDIYMGGIQLAPQGKGDAVFGPDSGRSTGTGAIRFVPAFLLPI